MLRFAATFAASFGLCCLGCQTTSPVATSAPTTEARPPAPGASLFETRWVLRQVGTQAVKVPEGGQEPYLLLRRVALWLGVGA